MEKLLRRLAIFTLTMMIFAFLMTSLVAQGPRRVHEGTAIPCLHPASAFCVALI